MQGEACSVDSARMAAARALNGVGKALQEQGQAAAELVP